MAMTVDMHFALAFLVGICVLAFSWNALGRRVINVVLGVQILLGLVLIGLHLAQHVPLEPQVMRHVGLAIAAASFYGAASGVERRRPDRGGVVLALSIAGLVCAGLALVLGMQMYFVR